MTNDLMTNYLMTNQLLIIERISNKTKIKNQR